MSLTQRLCSMDDLTDGLTDGRSDLKQISTDSCNTHRRLPWLGIPQRVLFSPDS